MKVTKEMIKTAQKNYEIFWTWLERNYPPPPRKGYRLYAESEGDFFYNRPHLAARLIKNRNTYMHPAKIPAIRTPQP